MPALPRLEDGGEFRQLEHKRTPSLYTFILYLFHVLSLVLIVPDAYSLVQIPLLVEDIRVFFHRSTRTHVFLGSNHSSGRIALHSLADRQWRVCPVCAVVTYTATGPWNWSPTPSATAASVPPKSWSHFLPWSQGFPIGTVSSAASLDTVSAPSWAAEWPQPTSSGSDEPGSTDKPTGDWTDWEFSGASPARAPESSPTGGYIEDQTAWTDWEGVVATSTTKAYMVLSMAGLDKLVGQHKNHSQNCYQYHSHWHDI